MEASFQTRNIYFEVDSTKVLAESNEGNNISPPLPTSAFNNVTMNIAFFDAGETNIIDPDGYFVALTDTNFRNTSLTAKIVQNNKGNRLGLASSTFQGETLKRAGKNLKLGKEVVGTVSGGKEAQPLTIQFNDNGTNLLINQVLKNLTFTSKKNVPGTRTYIVDLNTANSHTFSSGIKAIGVNPR
ncbi:MAG: hypothetical protein U0903_00640 [Planctomycetales bacterium]